MVNQFSLRPASILDIESIMNVERNGFISKIQEEKSVFEKRIKATPSLFLIFETQDKKTVGYLSAEYMEKIPEASEEIALGHTPKEGFTSKIIYISSFSILPEFRGNGTGSLLWNMSLNFLESNSGGNCTFVLLVNQEWKGARHIYEKSGFEALKIFTDFFPAEECVSLHENKSDGILMIRKLHHD